MAGFSWFSQQNGKGNILDPAGVFSGNSVKGMLLPSFGKGVDDMSTDQLVAHGLDPSGYFSKNSNNSSVLGQSRNDANVAKFEANPAPIPQFGYAQNPGATQYNPIISSYQAMLKPQGY